MRRLDPRPSRCALAVVLTFLAGCGAGGGGRSPEDPTGPTGPTDPTVPTEPPEILWRDDIQGTSELLGFDGFGVQHPIGTPVSPSDASGANLSRAPDPLTGGGFAMRHLGVFDGGGARAQAGIWGGADTLFGRVAKRTGGVWVAQEWYFPQAVTAPAGGGWLSVWDWHSTDVGGGNRWHTAPGLMVVGDGSMRVRLDWGGAAGEVNGRQGPSSSIALPVGRWFDVEMHYQWVDSRRGTIRVWIDGQLALEQRDVQTRASSHAVVETYMKWYGSTFNGGAWQPSPALKYTRNVRVAGERIWRPR